MNNKQVPRIPLHLWIGNPSVPNKQDDLVDYEVRLRVYNRSTRSHTIAIVRSDCNANPQVMRYLKIGDFGLTRSVLDDVILLCFQRLVRRMSKFDGSSADVWVANTAEWFQRRLSGEQAALAITAMLPHVDPQMDVPDASMVLQD